MDDSAITADELEQARQYSLILHWSDVDQMYIVDVPELPELRTHGRTVAEAIEMGEEAIATLLSALPDLGRTPPKPRWPKPFRAVVERAPRYRAEEVRAIRKRLGVSQELFAETLNVSPSAVRAWEQGQRRPDGAARRLLELADHAPLALFRSVGAHG
ncbi:MAG TPA: helix-turn-helix domain-containing protein [Thermomicrobiales bacterium]|nr:helix-turn-helix domain-containing protein [Thermomicrobiales bacterium]